MLLDDIISRLENGQYRSVIFIRFAWSMNSWAGWNHDTYQYAVDHNINYGFVKKYYLGHEWFNFYDFGDDFYYGYSPDSKYPLEQDFIEPALLVFVSKKDNDSGSQIIGMYSDAHMNKAIQFEQNVGQLIPQVKRDAIKQLLVQGGVHRSCKNDVLIFILFYLLLLYQVLDRDQDHLVVDIHPDGFL